MNLLQNTLEEIQTKRANGASRAALMTHVILGYPTLKDSIDIVRLMADSGASIIEMQIPFSDPIADGPTIMVANQRALENLVTPKDCMKAMEFLAKKVHVPLLFMSYLNLLINYQGGLKQFCKDAHSAGTQGLIVPDIPPEETSEGYWTLTRANQLIPIVVVSPVTTQERLQKLAKVATSGFVYCVSTTGTTGARKTLPHDLAEYLLTVREHFSLPLALGFGISTPEHIQTIGKHAEIAVVGSATIDLIRQTDKVSKKERLKKLREFVERMSFQ